MAGDNIAGQCVGLQNLKQRFNFASPQKFFNLSYFYYRGATKFYLYF